MTAISLTMALLLIGCRNSQPANPDSVDVAAIKSMTEQLIEAYVARDWDRFTSFFTDNAVWMPPDQPPLIGKEAWWSWIGGGWDQSTIQQATVNHEEIVIAGDWAFEWHTQTQVGEGWQVDFKGILILQRQDDGSWKIARYSFNRSPVLDAQAIDDILGAQAEEVFDFPFPTPTGQLRLVAWNIEFLGVREPPRTQEQLDAIAELIGSFDAPVLALQEVSDPAVLDYIRGQLGPSWKMYLAVENNAVNHLHGALLYNEKKVEALSLETLETLSNPPFSGYPSHRRPVSGLFRALEYDQRRFRVIGVHFCSGVSGCDIKRPAEGAWVRSKVLEYLATPGEPQDIFVMGDFNVRVGSTTFQNLEEGGDLIALPKGNSSSAGIDHAFITASSLSLVPEKESYFIFPSYYGISDFVKWRANYSDHRPVFFDFFIIVLPPEASFTATPDTGADPLTVEFDSSTSTVQAGRSLVLREWDFGDGSSGQGEILCHTYDRPGEYEVHLTVTDDQGITSAKATHSVVVDLRSNDVSP